MTMTVVKPDNVIYGLGVPELDAEGRVLTVDMGNVYIVNDYVPNSQKTPAREDYWHAWDLHSVVFL